MTNRTTTAAALCAAAMTTTMFAPTAGAVPMYATLFNTEASMEAGPIEAGKVIHDELSVAPLVDGGGNQVTTQFQVKDMTCDYTLRSDVIDITGMDLENNDDGDFYPEDVELSQVEDRIIGTTFTPINISDYAEVDAHPVGIGHESVAFPSVDITINEGIEGVESAVVTQHLVSDASTCEPGSHWAEVNNQDPQVPSTFYNYEGDILPVLHEADLTNEAQTIHSTPAEGAAPAPQDEGTQPEGEAPEMTQSAPLPDETPRQRIDSVPSGAVGGDAGDMPTITPGR